MSEEDWRAVASQMFIIERESTNLLAVMNGRTRAPVLDRCNWLSTCVSRAKSDLENEMYHQGIRDMKIFYPGEENKARATEESRELRERMVAEGSLLMGRLPVTPASVSG